MSFEDTVIIGAKVNTDMSFVTLGMEEERINFEIYLQRRDGKEHELVFTRTAMQEEDDPEDIWGVSGNADEDYTSESGGQ